MFGARDLLFMVVLLGSLPFCFMQPWIGVLMWSWLGYMNPHRFAYGGANWLLPSAMLVAGVTLAGFILNKDRKPFVWTRETILMMVLWIWFTVTTMVAMYPADAWAEWDRVSKILLMAFLTVPLFQDRRKLRILLLVIAFSIGFYGVKGMFSVLMTGGEFMVEGAPGNSSISANNSIALALNMCLPICLYLAKEEPRRWLRRLLWATFFCSMLTVPFTYSRGGVLGLVLVLGILFLQTRARAKVLIFPAALLGLVLFSAVVPEKWVARMQTLETYDEDPSANARMISWRVGIRLANDHPITGGGFTAYNPTTFAIYAPTYHNYHDAHSIYFNLLGEHGYPGLVIFLALILCLVGSLRRIKQQVAPFEDLQWLRNYAMMLQASIGGYLLTGAFLSAAYFDLAYHLFLIVVVLKKLAADETQLRRPQPAAFSWPIAVRRNEPKEAA